MDKKLKMDCASLLLLFAAFPLTSFGKMVGMNLIWCAGLLSLIVGGVLPVITRFMDHSADAVRDVGMEYDDRA